ncbi:hypothetical protein Dimus_015696 [Dionaea muscipula]
MEDLHASSSLRGSPCGQQISGVSPPCRQQAITAGKKPLWPVQPHVGISSSDDQRARKLHGVMRPTPGMYMAIPLNIDSSIWAVHVWWQANPRGRPRLVIGEFVVCH